MKSSRFFAPPTPTSGTRYIRWSGEKKKPTTTGSCTKPDVALGVEWGSTVQDPFVDDWLSFPNETASSHLAEITHNGAVVYQQHYVNVDGARCSLPLPEKHFKERPLSEPPEIDYYSVTEWAVGFMRLLNDVIGHERFDDYLRGAGFRVVS
jgi:hypothetical protein